jgi:8-oxo-dGTP pyrophosphatase MutT (NUDIX family)
VAEARVQFAQKAVIVHAGQVLMVRKSSTDPHRPGLWELPGGRLQPGEGLDDALVREVLEEVELAVVPGRPLALWSWTLGTAPDAPSVVAVARLCTAAADATLPAVPGEVDRAVWVPTADVLALDLIPSAREPIASALANLDPKETDHG